MATQLITSFKVEIIDVLNNGFIGKDYNSKKARIQDTSLFGNDFIEGQRLLVAIEVIDENDVKEDKKEKEFYVAINEFTNYGFYTKAVKEYEGLKRVFWYEERGMIMFPNDDWERFEVNDIIKVSIKKYERNNI